MKSLWPFPVRAALLLLLSTSLVGVLAVPAMGEPRRPPTPEEQLFQAITDYVNEAVGRVSQALILFKDGQVDEAIALLGEGRARPEAGDGRPSADPPPAGEVTDDERRRALVVIGQQMQDRLDRLRRGLDDLDKPAPDSLTRYRRWEAVRDSARWATYWAGEIAKDPLASAEQKEAAGKAKTEAELGALRGEVKSRLADIEALGRSRQEAIDRGDFQSAAEWDKLVKDSAASLETAAEGLAGHGAGTNEDKLGASKAQIVAAESLGAPVPQAPAADSTGELPAAEEPPPAADHTTDGKAGQVAGDQTADGAGGNTSQDAPPGNQANVGFSDGTMAVPGAIGQPGDKSGEDTHTGGDGDEDNTGAKEPERQPEPGGLAPGFELTSGDGGMELPGGIVGGNDQPAGADSGKPAPGRIAVPVVGGTVGFLAGDGSLLTMPPGQAANRTIFTQPDPNLGLEREGIPIPDLDLGLEQEIFAPPASLPTSTEEGAGTQVGGGVLGGIDLGGGPETEIPVQPPAGPGTVIGGPMPSDLIPPNYDAVGLG